MANLKDFSTLFLQKRLPIKIQALVLINLSLPPPQNLTNFEVLLYSNLTFKI